MARNLNSSEVFKGSVTFWNSLKDEGLQNAVTYRNGQAIVLDRINNEKDTCSMPWAEITPSGKLMKMRLIDSAEEFAFEARRNGSKVELVFDDGDVWRQVSKASFLSCEKKRKQKLLHSIQQNRKSAVVPVVRQPNRTEPDEPPRKRRRRTNAAGIQHSRYDMDVDMDVDDENKRPPKTPDKRAGYPAGNIVSKNRKAPSAMKAMEVIPMMSLGGCGDKRKSRLSNLQSLADIEYARTMSDLSFGDGGTNASAGLGCISPTNVYQQALRNREEFHKDLRIPRDFLEPAHALPTVKRRRIVKWIMEVVVSLQLREESLYLAIWLIDQKLLKMQKIGEKPKNRKVQIIVATCLLIAGKYHEVTTISSQTVCDVLNHNRCRRAFTVKQLNEMELELMLECGLTLSVPNEHTFLRNYQEYAPDGLKENKKMYERAMYFSRYVLELGLLYYRLRKVRSSRLAAAAYLCGLRICGFQWTPELEYLTGYPRSAIDQIYHKLYSLAVDQKDDGHYLTVTKYSTPEYGSVSSLRAPPSCP